MLKQIIFVVMEEERYNLEKKLEELSLALRKEQVELVLLSVSDWCQQREDLLQYDEKFLDTLFVTDTQKVLTELINQNFYAIAYYHDYNQKENLSMSGYGIEHPEELEYNSYDQIYKRLAGVPWEILTTDRLQVRETMVEDVEQFYRIYQEPSITEYMENLYEDKEEEIVYTKAYINQMYGFYGYGTWTVIRKKDGCIIGRAGLSCREGYEIPELGFVIEKRSQRQGYGYEVCQAILQYGKKELEFDQIQAFAEPGNLASIGLLRKLGFEEQEQITFGEKLYLRYLIGIL